MAETSRKSWRLPLAVIILSSCIGCDQATKSLATQSLLHSPPQTFLAGTIRLQYAQNPGGFLSLGSNLPEHVRQSLFVILNVGMMLAIGGFLIVRRNIPFAFFVALSYVLAGGIGNLIDRITNHGLVIDFLNVGVGPVRTGIFNVADIAVTFGGIAAVLLAPRQSSAEHSHVAEPASESVSNEEPLPPADAR